MMKPDKKSYSMHNKVLPKIVHIKGEDTIVIEVKQVWIETMPKYKIGHKRFPRFPKTKMVTTKQNTVFENNFKINKTFLKIFKHYAMFNFSPANFQSLIYLQWSCSMLQCKQSFPNFFMILYPKSITTFGNVCLFWA